MHAAPVGQVPAHEVSNGQPVIVPEQFSEQ
jgi:hypothetical protein